MSVKINLNENSYEVFINELDKLDVSKYDKIAILSNAKVAGLHMQSLLSKINAKEKFIITIKDGEEYKNLATIEEILNQMFISKLTRKSLLISFGGGVISDMGGFAASIYQRGIDFINIPTTLLACVDAAVGGKTGVNNNFGKNLIGSFYQPKAVFCESAFLKTLNERELKAGLAEFIKMAIIFEPSLLDFIQNINENDFLSMKISDEIMLKIIEKAVQLKAFVVEKDEKEAGLRMLLNYGHTFAHVIENETNYKTFLHGEAVAIGMHMANVLARNLGLLSQEQVDFIKQILTKFKLPSEYKIKNVNSFYEAFFLDKKSANAKLTFILSQNLQSGVIKNDIEKSVILKSLEAFA